MYRLLILSFILFSFISTSIARESVSFNPEELESSSPFKTEHHNKILLDVLKIMTRDFDEAKPLPEILVSEFITKDQTEIVTAIESQGIPFQFLEKGVNVYLIDLNIIVLGSKMKLHNLAHEYAHYVQVLYYGYTREDFQFDDAESTAVWVQNHFRD